MTKSLAVHSGADSGISQSVMLVTTDGITEVLAYGTAVRVERVR